MKYKVIEIINAGGTKIMKELNSFFMEESARLFMKNYIKYAVPNQIDRDIEVKLVKEL